MDETYVEELYECAINRQADIVYCDLFNFEKNEVYLKAQEFGIHSILVSNYISNCSLVKKAILKGTYYDETLSGKKLEDYDFFLNLIINNGAKAVYQPNAKLNYRVFQKGIQYATILKSILKFSRSILISYHMKSIKRLVKT